ncbi:MAG: site-2 protease family protein [Candidatus Binatia bacterium]
MREPISLRGRPYALGSDYPLYDSARTVAMRQPKVGRHILLFAATFVTATLANAHVQGVDLGAHPLGFVAGLPYAIALMGILLAHECGHYLLSRRYGVDATLPYFIPAPPTLFFFGTFGAFIRMRSLPRTRRALFDIGAAGPWGGIAVAVPALILGLSLSEVQVVGEPPMAGWMLGDSLLFRALVWLTCGVSTHDATIVLHPIALAGWVGLFVTALNLMPVGQLDGGHVVYAALGERWHRWISLGTVGALLFLGVSAAPSWLLWATLLAVLGVRHPRLPDGLTALDRPRRWGVAATLLLFALTFMPDPISFSRPAPRAPRPADAIPVAAPPAAPAGGVWV